MGISLDTARALAEQFAQRGITGRALTLGKQDLDFTLQQLLLTMSRLGLVTVNGSAINVSPHQKAVLDEYRANGRMLSRKPQQANAGILSDEFFFRLVGFSEVRSVDNSTYENADFVHDLNLTGMSATVGTFDFIYDGGTMEHVFHTPNVLRNIFETLNVGGTILHHSPTNNYVDHGFYQFSPTFFYDYYHANVYADVAVALGRNGGGLGLGAKYHPGMFDKFPPGSLDGAIYGTECYAKKTAASTFDRIPQQGEYVRVWAGGGRS